MVAFQIKKAFSCDTQLTTSHTLHSVPEQILNSNAPGAKAHSLEHLHAQAVRRVLLLDDTELTTSHALHSVPVQILNSNAPGAKAHSLERLHAKAVMRGSALLTLALHKMMPGKC